MGLIAGAEILNLPGVRDFFATYYPGPSQASYRANSTLGHYSAVGAFGLLTFILALSLAAFRHRDFPGWWLAAVMGASALGMLASGTWAALATLPVATVIVLFYARRVPRELIVTVACAAASIRRPFEPRLHRRAQNDVSHRRRAAHDPSSRRG